MYFYATYDKNVNEVFHREETSEYKFYNEKSELPWQEIGERIELWTIGDVKKGLVDKGYFMCGVKGHGIMIFNTEFKGDFRTSPAYDSYSVAMRRLKPFIREYIIDNLI